MTTCEICSRPTPTPCRLTLEQDGSRLMLEICDACRDRLLELVTPGTGERGTDDSAA